MFLPKWLLFLSIFSVSTAIRLTSNIVDMAITVHPEYGSSTCMPENTLNEGQAISTAIACNLTFIKEFSCDFKVAWQLKVVDKYRVNEFLITQDVDIGFNILKKTRGTLFASFLDSFKKCLHIEEFCPMYGVVNFRQCKIEFEVEAPTVGKYWKVLWEIFSQDEKMVFGGYMLTEIDDTDLKRQKRPTAAQRKRRKQ